MAQYGVVNMASVDASISTGPQGLVSRFGNWIKQPFSTDMDLVGWVLFTGLIIVLSGLWVVTVRKLSEEI